MIHFRIPERALVLKHGRTVIDGVGGSVSRGIKPSSRVSAPDLSQYTAREDSRCNAKTMYEEQRWK